MEAIVALGVPQEPVLFTVSLALMLLAKTFARISSSPTIRLRLIAEHAIIPEGIRTVLPTHRSNSRVVLLAERIAKCAVSLYVSRTGRDFFY